MAIRVANATANASTAIWEPCLATPVITTSTSTVTNAGIFTGTFTAPNTSGKTTGVMVHVATVPTNGGNFVVTLQEATVDTACTATINNADIKLGWQYVRFPTPYQWTAVTAGRYRFKISNSVGSSGALNLIAAASTVTFIDTHDSPATFGSTDDLFVTGFHDSGLTAKTVTVDGTSLVNGAGTDTAVSLTAPLTVGAGIQSCNGGTLVWDTVADATLQTRGSIVIHDGGTYDRRGNASDRTIVAKHIIDNNTSAGQYRIITKTGGTFLTNGYELTTPYAEYVSGTGTSGSRFTVDRATDWAVDDEIVIGGTAYGEREKRFIKTVYSSTTFQLATTAGGAEAALTYAHTATETVANITRNSVCEPANAARGTFFSNDIRVAADCNMNWSRWDNISQGSGTGVIQMDNSGVSDFTIDHMVLNGNGGGNRQGITWNSTTTRTITGLVCVDLASTNTGSGSVALGSIAVPCINQTLVDCFNIGSTSQGLYLTNAYGNTVTNFRASAGNTTGATAGASIHLSSTGGNTFNDCRIDSTRVQGIYLAGSLGDTFNNLRSGAIGTNTIDMLTVTNFKNDTLFADSNFSSATLISNYLNQLEGSEVRFQNMDDNTSKHRWYTNYGSWWSAGAGLTDTTVRTASSLSLVSKPENNSTGSNWTFKIPAAPTSRVAINGYVYRNATFSSGTLKVELFLPGTLLTATPDDTYTFPTTTGSWLDFGIGAYYSGAVARYATVRITGITSTAGAYFFIDDLYDAGTGNKVAGLDLWDSGKPSEIMVVTDFSSAVPVLALASAVEVWATSDSGTTAGTMGQRQVDAADDAELAAIK